MVFLDCALENRKLAHSFRDLARRYPTRADDFELMARKFFAQAHNLIASERKVRLSHARQRA